MSDMEVIVLSLTAEYMGIDSKCQLFRMLPDCLRTRIERSNRRRRALFSHLTTLRKRMGASIFSAPDYLIADSMPLEICKISRNSCSTVCKQEYYSAPDKGFCASKQTYFMAVNCMSSAR
jgi:transposase